jgi:hypothetical protein
MKLKLLITLSLFQLSFSQSRNCGSSLYMQEIMKDPVTKQNYLKLQEKFEIELSKLQNKQNKSEANVNTTIYIPVAVHFPNVATNSTDKNCLRQLAQNQINILNADFNATNADLALFTPAVRALYPGVIPGSLDVRFIIATQNHPAGTGLVNNDLAITFGTNFLSNLDYDIQWKGYLNLTVRDAGALGYAPVGGLPFLGGTAVIHFSAFGSGAGCPGYVPSGNYNLGRTVSHELGHYFNLLHTFGNVGGCGTDNDDLVSDTPQCNTSGNCPAIGTVLGCVVGEKSLTMDYMDYTDDPCMFMITAGQATRMRAFYNTISSQFYTNVLSSDEFKFKNFSLYPNPAKNTIYLDIDPTIQNEINKISIYNVLGELVYSANTYLQTIPLANISSGMYIVKISAPEFEIAKKLIVQ